MASFSGTYKNVIKTMSFSDIVDNYFCQEAVEKKIGKENEVTFYLYFNRPGVENCGLPVGMELG